MSREYHLERQPRIRGPSESKLGGKVTAPFVCLGEAEVRGEGKDDFLSLAGGLCVGGMTSAVPGPIRE